MTETSSILKLNTCLWGTLKEQAGSICQSFLQYSNPRSMGKSHSTQQGTESRLCVTNPSPDSFLYCGNQFRDAHVTQHRLVKTHEKRKFPLRYSYPTRKQAAHVQLED